MQTTIRKPVKVSGIGLHTGCHVSVELKPAPVDSGIIFRRVDLQGFEIEAVRRHVSRVVLATTLMKRGVMLSTVEHILSALYGSGIDNIYADVDSLELPILDGSALTYVQMLDEAGIEEQNKERTYLRVIKEATLQDGDKWIRIQPYPAFRVSYRIDFVHPLIGSQAFDLQVNPDSYAREVSFARTFGFYSEVEQLLKKGLIRGGSPENAVVLTEDGILNDGLRAEDEFVRHKTLDLIGDLSLCGYPLLGHVTAEKAGHSLHTDIATLLARNTSITRKVKESELAPERNAAAM
ncbi:MAG: UDP-3-O-acyl-N-acetylglucosamine deacetylase [Acidobacteria bacterium]|nr:MAG: UDP-3-O-acyl-N-acetylglucosamine deacetylase [Acidobacteriota bacterium]